MQNELISIIVPVYNMEQYLERCMESIFKQTYQNLEIILVDDGSTDRSPQMCDDYAAKDSRVKVVHKMNGGLSDARNAGLAIATGVYIGYVDSDDWIEPEMYETMYQACKGQKAQIAICRYFSIINGQKRKSGSGKQVPLSREELLNIYICGDDNCIIYNSVWSKLFHRSIVEDVTFPKGRNSEDIMYTTRAFCRVSKAVYIDSCLYNYVLDRQGSIMNEKRGERMFQDEIPFWKEHISMISEQVSEEMGQKAAYYFYRRLLYYYVDLQSSTDTRKYAKKIIDMLKEEKDYIHEIYQKSFVAKGDKVRMKVLQVSPVIYYVLNQIYNKWIIPLRSKE